MEAKGSFETFMALYHAAWHSITIPYYSSIPIPKLHFLISAYYNLFTKENIPLKEQRFWMVHNDEHLRETTLAEGS